MEAEAVFSATGGARIGWVNATWPFAKLVASSSLLSLRSLQGTYDFVPGDVVSLERYGSIPFFSSGVRIVHARRDYPSKIIFWYLGAPELILAKVREAGFLPTAPASAESRWRGMPVRWTAILLFILIWNGLFLPIRLGTRNLAGPSSGLVLVPLLAAFLACWGIKLSPRFQKMVLSDGHSVSEIKAWLSLIQAVSGLLLVIFAFVAVFVR
jgi:hypothetical protein